MTQAMVMETLQARVATLFRERYDGEGQAFANKLVEEAQELADAYEDDVEAADVLICLLGWLDARAITWDELLEIAHAKMTINENRRWERQSDGSWKHR